MNITRRTAIRGAGAAFAGAGLSIAASTLSPASEHRSVPQELSALCDEYHAAHVAARAAELAWRDAEDVYRKQLREACIWVPYTGFGSYFALVGGGYREVHVSTAEHQLKKDLAKALDAAANDPAERRRIRRRHRTLERKVADAKTRVDRMRIDSGLEAAIDADTDARRRSYDAKDALMAYRPTMLEEVAVITRCLFVTAKETESFHSYPAYQVCLMLNPDLEV